MQFRIWLKSWLLEYAKGASYRPEFTGFMPSVELALWALYLYFPYAARQVMRNRLD